MLKAIDSDVNIAVEKCLVFLANLASTLPMTNGIDLNHIASANQIRK
jgi:hypothetical protein